MKTKACSLCIINCLKLHGEVDEDKDKDAEEEISPGGSPRGTQETKENSTAPRPYPSFIKKMTEYNIASALQMPPSFVKNSVTRIGTTVTLEGPSEENWSVEVGPRTFQKCTLEFSHGWQKFVADHALQIGDQLTFTLTRDSHFQVLVYDESGAQKVSATDAINSPFTINQGTQVGISVQSFRSKGPVARPKLKVRRANQTESAVKPVVHARPKLKVRRTNRTENALKPVVHAVHSSESELRNNDPPPNECKLEEITSASREKSQDRPDTDVTHYKYSPLPPHVLLDGCVISQRRLVTQAEKDRALQAAQALVSTLANPKLVVVMTKGHAYKRFWLPFSKPFARAYMPHESREVTLLNKAGHKWSVLWLNKTYEAGNNASGFSGGWRRFALDHRLEESDVCVFEVADKNDFDINVHIFRAIGKPGEDDVQHYRPTRNADKRKRKAPEFFHHADGKHFSTPTKECFNLGSSKSPAGCSKAEHSDQTLRIYMASCSKQSPKGAENVGQGETLQKVGFSPTPISSRNADDVP